MNKVDKTFLIFISIFVGAILIAAIFDQVTQKSEHDIRMELIEEKEALYRLERSLESDKSYRETKHFVDSLNREINKQLK